MIKSFKHKGLQKFFETGSTKGIQVMHANKISRLLAILNNLTGLNDLSSPAFRLHPLKGDMEGLWALTVQTNWRITFKYEQETSDVYIVDYQDYH